MDKQLAISWQSPLSQLVTSQIALIAHIKAMQEESIAWHDEHREWKRDIVGWLKKQRRLEAMLYQLERELPDYREVAAHLSDVIEDHEIRLSEHEKLLIRYLDSEVDPAKWKKLDAEHSKQAKLHAEAKEEHDAFRAAYLAAMKRVDRLVKRLQALCH